VRTLDDPRTAIRVVVASVVGVLAFAVFAATPGSPFQPVLPQGFTAGGPLVWVGRRMFLDRLSGNALVTAGVLVTVLAVSSFLFLLLEAWRGNVSLRTVLLLVAGYHVVILGLPLLFSRDVYSYSFYGRIVGIYHGNPYVHTPLAYARDPLWHLLGPKWVNTPAVYGPLFSSLSGVIARSFATPIAQVNAYRVMAIVASMGTVLVSAWTARQVWPSRAAFAVVAVGANPVVLFDSVASGHNDLLVALSIVVALAFLVRGRELPAIVSLSLGALIKAAGVLPLILLIVYCVARRPPEQRRRALVTHLGAAVVVCLAAAAPYMQRHDPTLGMLELATHEQWLAPSLFLRRVVDATSFHLLGWVVRVGFALLLAFVVTVLCVEVGKRARTLSPLGNGAAWGWILLVLMLMGPVLLPWYVVWAMPLAWLLPRAARSAIIGTGVLLALAQWSTESINYPGPFAVDSWIGHWLVTPAVTILLVWMLVDFRRRIRGGLPLEAEEEEPAPSGRA
jgi:hypothetical protein